MTSAFGNVVGGPLAAIDSRSKVGRRGIQRRTVDFTGPVSRSFLGASSNPTRDFRDSETIQPHIAWLGAVPLPADSGANPVTSACTNFVHMSVNKVRCAVNCLVWTPEGRRLLTGAASGEFTLWNGFTFNFETITQAHESPVRCVCWTRNDSWLVSGDNTGTVKYWQPNMSNVKAFAAHNESVRDISFAPSDTKFVSCSDDLGIKVWDFFLCKEETLLAGHGSDVRSADWHPYSSLIVSGSKDQRIKLWDARTGKCVSTLDLHKNVVVRTKWNRNGNWFLSCSRDQLIKLWDVRMMRELGIFRGHRREVTTIKWHPFHENFFASGGYEGTVNFWCVGQEDPVADITAAHENSVCDIAWHPLGHILATCSNDHTTKFWSRNRPGDSLQDRHSRDRFADQMEEDYAGMGPAPTSASGFASSFPGLPPTVATQPTAARTAAPAIAVPPVASSFFVPGEATQVAIPGMSAPPPQPPSRT